MDKIVIVVEHGAVQNVYGACPYQAEIEVLDLDCNGSDPDAESVLRDRLNTVRQYLCKIY